MNFKNQKSPIMKNISEFIVKRIKTSKIIFFTIIAIALILGIVFVKLFICSRIHKIEEKSSERLSEAYTSFAQGNQKKGVALIDEIIAQFPKTPASYQARLIKADILVELRDYDGALAILTYTASNGEPGSIRSLASARIIYVYDSKKDYFNAIVASNEFINKYPDHFLIRDIYLNLAEYYLTSGSKDDTVRVFNEILVNFPATPEAEKAQNRLNQIK
ncbi:MAG: tetratricopeptide repeat protein [Endomicrobium sp.]|jgi:outer membrane protein assembly factor BamD (BamD/ComL family)|nr:tetratricopeptide repeat protein [Endomicrobium sp.]